MVTNADEKVDGPPDAAMGSRPLARLAGPALLFVAACIIGLSFYLPLAMNDSGGRRGDFPSPTADPETIEAPPAWLLPFDDAYIFIRYAQQAARGRPFQWTDDVYSSGASSFLYPILLVPAHWLSDSIAFWSRWSACVGLLGLWLAAWASFTLLRRLGLPSPWPLAGGLTVICWGPIATSSLTGMETGWATAALVCAIMAWHDLYVGRPDRRPIGHWGTGWRLASIAVLPLIRPELGALTSLAALSFFVGRPTTPVRWLAPLLLVPGIGLVTLNYLLTGAPMPSGAQSKSLSSLPFFTPRAFLKFYVLGIGNSLVPIYTGLRPMLLPVGVGLAAILTALATAFPRARAAFRDTFARPTLMMPLVVTWAVLLVTAPVSTHLMWQAVRHHQPALVLAWMLALIGAAWVFDRALRRLAGRGLETSPARFVAILVPVLLSTTVPYWSHQFFATAFDLQRANGRIAGFLAEQRRDAVLLVNDAGLHSLAHDGPAIDLFGLGSPSLVKPFLHGPGAITETLAREPRLPAIAAVNLHFLSLPLFGEVLLQPAQLRGRPQSESMVLAEVRRSMLAGTPLAGPGVDFGYLRDEESVHARWTPPPPYEVATLAIIVGIDGALTLHGCRLLPGRLEIELPAGVRAVTLSSPTLGSEAARIDIKADGVDEPLGRLEIEDPSEPPTLATLTVNLPDDARRLILEKVEAGATPCVESLAFTDVAFTDVVAP